MNAASEISWLTSRPIAHRGLHDRAKGVPENSLSAFQAAIDGGYAIECDIRLSGDGVPVVFHDAELRRMTGASGLVVEKTASELARLHLHDGTDHVPTVLELLELVDGRVPLVVELKGSSPRADAAFSAALTPLLADYSGPIALMSFEDWLIDQAAVFADRLPVGLTAEGTKPEVLERHGATFGERCSFVSYNLHHLPNEFARRVRDEKRLPVISWTVRTPQDEERSRLHADQITFEGFVPQP